GRRLHLQIGRVRRGGEVAARGVGIVRPHGRQGEGERLVEGLQALAREAFGGDGELAAVQRAQRRELLPGEAELRGGLLPRREEARLVRGIGEEARDGEAHRGQAHAAAPSRMLRAWRTSPSRSAKGGKPASRSMRTPAGGATSQRYSSRSHVSWLTGALCVSWWRPSAWTPPARCTCTTRSR